MNGIEKAIYIAGSQTKLAKLLGITPQAVQKWAGGKQVPVTRSIEIERVLNGKITRCELRPDIFLDVNSSESIKQVTAA